MFSRIAKTSITSQRAAAIRPLLPGAAVAFRRPITTGHNTSSVEHRPINIDHRPVTGDNRPINTADHRPAAGTDYHFGPASDNQRLVTNTPLDYHNEIMVDHNNFRDLHKRFLDAYNRNNIRLLDEIANTFVYEVAVHSAGEELSVYKELDKRGLHGDAETDRAKHYEIKKAMSYLDSNSVASLGIDSFAIAFLSACKPLFEHIEEEEQVHYKKLSATLSPVQKANLALEFLRARDKAPGRPHTSSPQTGGIAQKIMGAMAKPVDAAMNSARNYVELKHKHADPNIDLLFE